MLLEEVMQQLEEYGTEQNRKTYKNHGAKEPLFGVSFANLKLLKKKIKKDHDLAILLWETKKYGCKDISNNDFRSKESYDRTAK